MSVCFLIITYSLLISVPSILFNILQDQLAAQMPSSLCSTYSVSWEMMNSLVSGKSLQFLKRSQMYLKDCSWLIRLMMLSLICMTIYSSCKLIFISFWFKFHSKNLYSLSQSWVSVVFLRVENKHLTSLVLNYGWKNIH